MVNAMSSKMFVPCGYLRKICAFMPGLLLLAEIEGCKPASERNQADVVSDVAAAQTALAKKIGEKVTYDNSIGMNLTLVPPGEFMMGSMESEIGPRGMHSGNEKQHRVTITKPFYLGTYSVTRGQFSQFVAAETYQTEAERDGTGAYGMDAGDKIEQKAWYTWQNPGMCGNKQTDEHPVVSVSWNDAVEFCKWLSKKEGKNYRLPTEAEWEYACRAGSKTAFNFGNALNGTQANCNGGFSYGTSTKGPYLKATTKGGSYAPNVLGLYDMHGNAQQWCADWYDQDYYANSPQDDPPGPSTGTRRIIRGGGWASDAVDCRSANRDFDKPNFRDPCVGFRVVLEH